MSNHLVSTTLLLTHWERQSTVAERMCADILRLEGFTDLDPQSPIGGPDDGKDILCNKGGASFAAACYFPTKPVSFVKTKDKFESDLEASLKHKREGFIFLTNQSLTPGNRTDLEVIAAGKGKRALIFHREYLRVCLDSPSGYGVRLKHLNIPLSTEEQFAYFASSREAVTQAISENTSAIQRISFQIEKSARAQRELVHHTTAVIMHAVRSNSKIDDDQMLKASSLITFNSASIISNSLISGQMSVALICYIHRLLAPTSPHLLGKLRQTQVWIADATGKLIEGFQAPTWDQVPDLLDTLAKDWNGSFQNMLDNPLQSPLPRIAKFFHKFLVIHPFVDGNGRVARQIASLQLRELLGIDGDISFADGPEYYRALSQADKNNYTALEQLLFNAFQA